MSVFLASKHVIILLIVTKLLIDILEKNTAYKNNSYIKPTHTRTMNGDVLRELETYQKTGKRGLIPMEPSTQGTIVDYLDFDPLTDCELLRKAMKGIGTDEKAITMILARRSNNQRQIIKTHFASMFGKDLIKELKSELSGNYEKTVLELLMSPDEYDAYLCRNAIEGLGTDETCLIEVLGSRSNSNIQALREAYTRLYKKDLEKDIKDDTSGHFRRLLVSLTTGARSEYEPVDFQRASQDATALYKAGEGRWGTDESRFNAILAAKSFPQLRITFDEYDKISKHTLEEAIKSEMSGDVREGMLAVVKCARNRPGFFAECLYHSMKGLGTNDKTLIRIIVSRSEIDMVQIKEAFMRRFQKTLESFISDDCSGDYKKILLQLCAGNH